MNTNYNIREFNINAPAYTFNKEGHPMHGQDLPEEALTVTVQMLPRAFNLTVVISVSNEHAIVAMISYGHGWAATIGIQAPDDIVGFNPIKNTTDINEACICLSAELVRLWKITEADANKIVHYITHTGN